MSNPAVGRHISEFKGLLRTLRANRATPICKLDLNLVMLRVTELSGYEERPLWDKEVRAIIENYRIMKEGAIKEGLLPPPRLRNRA